MSAINHRKKDIADALRSSADRLNFLMAMARVEGFQVKLIINSNVANRAEITQVLEVEVTDLPNHELTEKPNQSRQA